MRGSGQRLPITLRFTRVLGTFSHTTCFPFSCALWACFSDRSVSGERSEPIGALMPHAALWVVQQNYGESPIMNIVGFNAARGFVGGAAPYLSRSRRRTYRFNAARGFVGGAASRLAFRENLPTCFNAARGFVGGAAEVMLLYLDDTSRFQCRTRLCGWCSLVALSSFPPRGKKPFWKVSGNLRCLTENM